MFEFTAKLFRLLILPLMCAAALNLGYVAFFGLVVVLAPDRMVAYAPSTDPSRPLTRFGFDPRFNDWFTTAKVELIAQTARFRIEHLNLWHFLAVLWILLYATGGMLAGRAVFLLFFTRFQWSRQAARSFRFQPPTQNTFRLMVASLVVGFLWCGLLHEALRLFEEPEIKLLLPGTNAILLGTLLGAASVTWQVLERRRQPVASKAVCLRCGYDATGLQSTICPECAGAIAQTDRAAPAPARELGFAQGAITTLLILAAAVLVLRPGNAAYHQSVINSALTTQVGLAPGQGVRFTTKDGSWVLRCEGTPTVNESGIAILRDVVCTLTQEGSTGPAATSTVRGQLPDIFASEPIAPLRFGNGSLRVDVLPWGQYPTLLFVSVLGRAEVEAVK